MSSTPAYKPHPTINHCKFVFDNISRCEAIFGSQTPEDRELSCKRIQCFPRSEKMFIFENRFTFE